MKKLTQAQIKYLRELNCQFIISRRSCCKTKPYYKQWKWYECLFMNIVDFRYWFCECHYYPPYGKVISADCKRHDAMPHEFVEESN